ncbi:OB-fold domain-containing protein [Paracoccus sp. pheM1]|uniref:OB-fold domain-containing protein n=1 Tax=Paracoccus sp. pheM1 TaxID=2831675 RepID=UPI001BDB928D|nr:OB-fold domain-containing protein [Paracoccus sp. pheM1]MBT0782940.1 OB-fold domain-containing protein [Paracoccus sp. pheM1]
MANRSIKSTGAYLPLLRFERKAARAELAWSGLGGNGKGRRAVAGWDEDALTQAVEAAREALAPAQGAIARVVFASTSSAFSDRSQAVLLADALSIARDAETADLANCRRSAVSALLRALRGAPGEELIAAGEKRATQPGSPAHLSWGDGAAAAVVGDGPGVARLLGAGRVNLDLLDSHTSVARGLPYAAEERFARDAIVSEALIPAAQVALAEAGLRGEDVALAVVPEAVSGLYAAAARKLGMSAPNVIDRLGAGAGDLGTAAPLFGLALALEQAEPGQIVLLAGCGNGCDVLVLEVTAKTDRRPAHQALDEGAPLASYSRLLSLTGGIDLDWGPRAEVNQKVSASVLARHGREMHGFVGGRDQSGNVQFPKTPMPVSPALAEPGVYQDVILRDEPARVVSITADRLNFTPDPPFYFGLVQFENGARVVMEHCDVEGEAQEVGAPLRMRFRIKAIDRQRQFRSYFWKAAPLARPQLAAKE